MRWPAWLHRGGVAAALDRNVGCLWLCGGGGCRACGGHGMSVVLSLGSATRYNRYLLLERMGKHSAIDRPMSEASAGPCHHGRLAGHFLLRLPIPFLHAVVWRGSTGCTAKRKPSASSIADRLCSPGLPWGDSVR